MNAWLDHNRHSLGLALKRMAGMPFAALFSILVIGIALSLPAGLYVVLKNVDRLAGSLPAKPQITLFLKTDLPPDQGRALADRIAGEHKHAAVGFVSRDAGLKHLRDAGLSDLTDGLGGNPLPDVVTVTPAAADADALQRLGQGLKALPGVDHMVMDDDWARRLNAVLAFGQDMVWLLAVLLGIALAAIAGNTIRLQIYAAREEIEVSQLIGATRRFIRRPFLYYGALQGLLGGLAAWAIVAGGLQALQPSLDHLALAWDGRLALDGLGLSEAAALLAAAALLGFSGAFLAVGHSLRRIERMR